MSILKIISSTSNPHGTTKKSVKQKKSSTAAVVRHVLVVLRGLLGRLVDNGGGIEEAVGLRINNNT